MLFNLTSNYVSHLSKLTIDDDGYDYASDVIPQAIVVGIFHNDRGYETTPNVSQYPNIDETRYSEGSEKLKNFIFNEVIPYIETNYSNSGYNSIIGHSNTAHFVMCLPFQESNPFKGIISLSLGGYSDTFKNKITSYLKTNSNTNIFIGYGVKDYGFNELAKYINKNVEKNNLKVSQFNANHNEMPAISLTQGLKFLFKKYRNIDDFNRMSKAKDFDVNQYLKHYREKNKQTYGINTTIKEDDFYSLIDMSINSKNKKAFNQLLDYDYKVNGNLQQTHMLFIYNQQLKDFKAAEGYLNKLMASEDKLDIRILKANLDKYYEFYVNDVKDVNKAIDFFEKGKKQFKDTKLEFSYFLAKACLKNDVKKNLGARNLKYCLNHFEKNRYFRKVDLKNWKTNG